MHEQQQQQLLHGIGFDDVVVIVFHVGVAFVIDVGSAVAANVGDVSATGTASFDGLVKNFRNAKENFKKSRMDSKMSEKKTN